MDTGVDGPPVIRPIPRRPFELKFSNPTPPEEDSNPSSPVNAGDRAASPSLVAGLLDPNQDSGSLSRNASFRNLTSSALFGIFAPTTTSRSHVLDDLYDRDAPATPWGTGSETPPDGSNLDEATYEVLKERSKGTSAYTIRRRSSHGPASGSKTTLSTLAARAGLLFALGVGYGMLVTRLHSDQDTGLAEAFGVERLVPVGGYDWRYLTFWGVAGVGLGGLLPWFDGVWEAKFSRAQGIARGNDFPNGERANPETDWALVVRGIGAFVGIVFAIVSTTFFSDFRPLPSLTPIPSSQPLGFGFPRLRISHLGCDSLTNTNKTPSTAQTTLGIHDASVPNPSIS